MSSNNGAERATALPAARTAWSLAVRMALGFALSAFALVLVVVGVLYLDIEERLRGEDDEFLVDNVTILAELLREQPVDEEALFREVVWEWAARRHARVYVRVLREADRTPLETPGMSEILPADAFPPARAVEEAPHALADLDVAHDRPFRLASARLGAAPGEPPTVIQVALDRHDDDLLLAGYRARLLSVLCAAFVASGVVGYLVGQRGMRPVRRMAIAVGHIRSTNLGERLEPAKMPRELAVLATTFNEMLDRLEGSFDRLSRFSADLAHELRTPVQNLRGEMEVALGRDRTAAEYRDLLGSCLEECVRLSELIDRLLFLARADDPRTQIRREPVNLARELATVRDFYEASATEKGVTLRVRAAAGVDARLDRMLLQRALGNLLANALAHTPRGGDVTLVAERSDDSVAVRVEDTGVGIPEEAQRHVFERFFRADPARSGNARGAGLGLAIVQSIVQLHGGAVSLSSAPGRGTTVTLILPDEMTAS